MTIRHEMLKKYQRKELRERIILNMDQDKTQENHQEASATDLIESFGRKVGTKGKGEFVRENLIELESNWLRLFANSSTPDNESLLRDLWTQLVKLSVKLHNIDLALLLVPKLKCNRLVKAIQSTLSPKATDFGISASLILVANEFGVEYQGQIDQLLSINRTNKSCRLYEYDALIKLFVDEARWLEAFELIDKVFDRPRAQLNKRRLHFKWARFLETDEYFQDCLKQHEQAQTESDHWMRLLFKSHLDVAPRYIEAYCKQLDDLDTSRTSLLMDYLQVFAHSTPGFDRARAAWSSGKLDGFSSTQLFSLVARSSPNQSEWFEGQIVERLGDDKLRKLIGLADFKSNHSDKRSLSGLTVAGACLSSALRGQIGQLACWYLSQGQQQRLKADRLLICLGQYEAYIRCSNDSERWTRLETISRQPMVDDELLASQLCECLARPQVKPGAQSSANNLGFPLLKLGLADESLSHLTSSLGNAAGRANFGEALEWFWHEIEAKVGSAEPSWASMDPQISESTLAQVYAYLRGAEQQQAEFMATNVIKFVINCLTVYIDKLSCNSNGSNQISSNLNSNPRQAQSDSDKLAEVQQLTGLRKLETMFNYLAKYLGDFNFSLGAGETGNQLIKATSSLMKLAKSKMDAIRDSELIRDSFRRLVESVASRCMIEARYKQAASLFSQMGNQIEACKCLMRTGDIEIVTKFASLSSDIAVNRITLNYLRHLNAKPEVIRDFIARTQGPKASEPNDEAFEAFKPRG